MPIPKLPITEPTMPRVMMVPSGIPQFLKATKKKDIATIKLMTAKQNVNLNPLVLVILLLISNIIGIGAKAAEFITVIFQLEPFIPIATPAILV
ncbi:hypothetical protein FACS1894218_1250 [Bacilli bacterium]|nr:hypothetical protein FACS1894218_1250 [Bacilli bacterium]